MSKDKITGFSKALVDELTEVIQCPRDYFTLELVETTYIFDGEEVQGYPFIEVFWFDRGQNVQDKTAEIITKYVQQAGYPDSDISFTVFKENCYYENGKHF